MKVIVQKHKILLEKEPINEKEINVSYCEFEFDEDITNDFVKEAYFTLEDKTYKQIINNNKCDYPAEILDKSGVVMIGVVAYKVIDESTEIRYNPSPAYFYTLIGSLKEAENTQPITPSEMEQYMQLLEDGLEEVANVDIDIETTISGADVTITNRQGEEKTAHILNGLNGKDGKDGIDGKDGHDGTNGKDGVDGQPGKDGKDGKDGTNGTNGQDGIGLNYNWSGTSLGVKRENEQDYSYVNLKGDTGANGQDGQPGQNGRDGQNGQDGRDGTILLTDTYTEENPLIIENLKANTSYKFINGSMVYAKALSTSTTPTPIITNNFDRANAILVVVEKPTSTTIDETLLFYYTNFTIGGTGGDELRLTTTNYKYTSGSGYPSNLKKSTTTSSLGKIINSNAQTFSGTKTFSSLPECSSTPTTNNQLVNKSYVDSAITGALSTSY